MLDGGVECIGVLLYYLVLGYLQLLVMRVIIEAICAFTCVCALPPVLEALAVEFKAVSLLAYTPLKHLMTKTVT